MNLTNDQEFKGDINNALRQASAASGVSGTLQIRTTLPDGSYEWVDVPDGMLSASNYTFYAIPNQTYRFTNVSGGAIWVS